MTLISVLKIDLIVVIIPYNSNNTHWYLITIDL